MPHRASLACWILTPRRALARESGLERRTCGRLLGQSRRRLRLHVVGVVALQIVTMVAWLLVVSRFVGIYETTTTFGPSGASISEVTTGPFGVTTMPLILGLLAGPVGAMAAGAVVGLLAHFAWVDREARRCARVPACFHCGYDLSSISGAVCPECGEAQPHLTGRDTARTVTP